MNRETTLCAGSSNISEFTYDAPSGQLEVVFQDGSSYVYSNVTREEHYRFQRSGSRGEFFYRHIRRAKAYTEGRLPPVDEQG